MQLSRTGAGGNTETVTTRLRELILDGTLPQGERVTEEGLASLLRVSRTPIRLALATLAQEELVQGERHRGFRVRQFTADDMREIIEVRSTLEGMTARLAAENGASAGQQAALTDCLEAVDELIAAKQVDKAHFRRFSEINIRFHATIAEIADNVTLTRLLERSTTIPFRSAPLLYLLPPEEALGAMIASQRDHVRLVDAIRGGHATRAEFLMREHALMPLTNAQLFESRNMSLLSMLNVGSRSL